MSAWMDVVVSHLYPWPIGVLITGSALSLFVGFGGLWALWRVRRLLTVVPVLQERIETLSHSMALLTDTTESCFKALSMQLQFMQTQTQTQQAQQAREVGPTARPRVQVPAVAHEDVGTKKARQRRVIGAARRGEALAAIAAREEVSESEVALRVHLNQQPPAAAAAEIKRHGALLS